ncbi:hypothetical protein Salat_1051000 [Sesamum alatum]|uniref:Uncharacterized protein n=1 Tax=Sesamum alatum TaxID=300844 RepID=A0AAE2CSI5_9LAMI|nr:hypothetical protein Salat_1051000 [Sesamum alatum]
MADIFVIKSNSEQILPRLRLEDCRLYRLNVSELLSKPDVYESFFKVLSDVSNSEINKEMLTMMAANSRHEVYVLLGPVENWNGDEPTIYSAIQHELSLISNPQQCYANTAVQLMTRYYNGDAAEDVLPLVPELEGHIIFIQLQRRTWPLVHYVGVLDQPNPAQFDIWTSNGFSPIFFGKIKSEKEAICAMIKWLNDYEPVAATNEKWSHVWLFARARCCFKVALSRNLTSLDHSFALRILDMPYSGYVLPLRERPWSEIDALELMEPEIWHVAGLYFDRLLPIPLSELERALLLLRGLQYRPSDEIMRIMDLPEDFIKASFRKILVKALDCDVGAIIFPEVSD